MVKKLDLVIRWKIQAKYSLAGLKQTQLGTETASSRFTLQRKDVFAGHLAKDDKRKRI